MPKMTGADRVAVHDAVIEAATIRRMGRDNADREGLAWRVVAILERNAEMSEPGRSEEVDM